MNNNKTVKLDSIIKCPGCGAEHDAITSLNEDDNVNISKGDIKICYDCGVISVFTGNGIECRKATNEEDIMYKSNSIVGREYVKILLRKSLAKD